MAAFGMDPPQKHQRSWLSGFTSLVGGGRPAAIESPSTVSVSRNGGSGRPRVAPAEVQTPSRSSNSFRAPSPDSPESPVRRASPSLLAQRKVFDRPQGPSTKLGANVPRATNFSVSTTPRSFFRGSALRDNATFSFTPKVPPNTMRASFPPHTPGRSYRTSAAEIEGRGMSKTTSSDLFRMKIPEPDPALTGEVIAKQVPEDPSRSRSIYADQYLDHLCPPEFDEAERSQWFCVMDLRRLKYAADEIFAKKDWRLNILNFAKEYEKSRSLIMLRYGLYEFKSVKVSEEVLQRWKMAHNIPVFEKERVDAPRVNATQGILRKRKPEDEPQSSNSTKNPGPTGSKRARTTEAARPPLVETTTPALNSGNKRKASVHDTADEENPPSKIQKTPKKPSATKAFLEMVANTPATTTETEAKETSAPSAVAPSVQVSKLSAGAQTSSKPRFQGFAQPGKAKEDLARSVLESGLKPGGSQSSNIFGYLSDASSAKGSGNENADADADGEDTEESEEEEQSEPRDASQSDEASLAASGGIDTPQTGSWLPPSKPSLGFPGSSASSDASEPPKSLLDRINRDGNGDPIRVLGQNKTMPKFGSKETPGRAPSPEKPASPPEKPPTATPVNNTWKPDSPIKFAAESGFKPTSSIFASKPAASQATSLSFGAGTTVKAAEKPFEQQPSENADSNGTKPHTDSPDKPSTAGGNTPLFGSEAAKSSAPASTTLFGQPKGATPALSDKPTGALSTSIFAPKASDAKDSPFMSKTLFGSDTPKPDEVKATPPQTSQSLFSSTTQLGDTGMLAMANSPVATPLFGAASAKTSSMFGTTDSTSVNGEQPQAKSPFGNSSATPAPSIFNLGGSKVNGISDGEKAAKPTQDKPLFPSTTTPADSRQANPLFGGASASGTQSNIFGSTPAPAAPAASAPIFNFGGSQPSAPAFGFGSSAPSDPPRPSGPVIFGGGNDTSAPSSFTFNAAPAQDSQPFRNPFATGDAAASATPSFDFGSAANGTTGQASGGLFQFGAGSGTTTPAGPATGSTPTFAFGGTPPASGPPAASNIFGAGSNGGSSGATFNFGGPTAHQPSGSSIFAQQKPSSSLFNLAPLAGGTSTGTNTPFTFGGASSLATTPATGTPEPGAVQDNADQGRQEADGDERPQEQISLTEGGPGEEDETVVYEVRAKAMKLVTSKEGSDSESNAAGKDKKSPWKLQGVGPLRILKHKTTGAVRLLLRSEPRGHVALNKALLPNFTYKPEPPGKYVKLTTSGDSGASLETWMLQVKTKEAAQALSDALEANKGSGK